MRMSLQSSVDMSRAVRFQRSLTVRMVWGQPHNTSTHCCSEGEGGGGGGGVGRKTINYVKTTSLAYDMKNHTNVFMKNHANMEFHL